MYSQCNCNSVTGSTPHVLHLLLAQQHLPHHVSTSTFSPPILVPRMSCFCLCVVSVVCDAPEKDNSSISNILLDRLPLHPHSTSNTTYLEEHKYCMRGTRYFPQKSTNLICSTWLSKNTPVHLGFTQQLALARYSTSVCGMSSAVTRTSLDLSTRADSSSKDGGLNAMSWTNCTTSGLSRRLNCNRTKETNKQTKVRSIPVPTYTMYVRS